MSIDKIIKALEVRARMLAKERDKLRDMEDQIAEYRYRASTAVEDIESAINTLSELV